MGRTIKVYHCDNLESLKAHVLACVTACNFAKHLKAFRWRTSYLVIWEAWTKGRSISQSDPPPHSGTTHLAAPLLARRPAYPLGSQNPQKLISAPRHIP